MGVEFVALDERKREWETARARLAAIESRLADRLIKAPFAGVLGLRNISVGAFIEPGDVITTLDDDRVMKQPVQQCRDVACCARSRYCRVVQSSVSTHAVAGADHCLLVQTRFANRLGFAVLALRATVGEIILQGPHHAAQKSTRTG